MPAFFRFARPAALALALTLACTAAAPMGFVGFYFVGKALDAIGQAAWAPVARLPARPPSWAASLGAAGLINERLPMESRDGFAIVKARAPAPGALEIVVSAPKGHSASASELDAAWGPGIVDLFCGPRDTIWTRWIKIGGSVGLSVETPSGESIRRYGASGSDCEALARRER